VRSPLPIRSLGEVSRSDTAEVGGKAAALGEVAGAGCDIPPGFVVPRRYREQWSRGEPDPSFGEQVRRACELVGASSYAVRSSAVVEDGGSASWAGQFDTYLGVAPDAVPARIIDCWKSPGSVHATEYARQHGASEQRWEMAVVVQEMIDSEVSGVLFTVDPVSGDRSTCALEAVAGLGELLVQGRVTPQAYTIDRATRRILSERPHRQRTQLKLAGTGTRELALPAGYDLPLGSGTITRLVGIGLRLEQHFGAPQDIEWTCSGGSLFVLQSRPVTTL
jgi:phosphoenolpyruvate synthase/pyruvate phosphate dikinase